MRSVPTRKCICLIDDKKIKLDFWARLFWSSILTSFSMILLVKTRVPARGLVSGIEGAFLIRRGDGVWSRE